MTLHLYRAAGEQNRRDDIRDELRAAGIEPGFIRQNPPTTHDVWMVVLDLVQNHGQHVVTGTALLGLLAHWLKQRKGRRVEIERHGLKVKAPSARELKKALMALYDFDRLSLTLNKASPVQGVTKKKAAKKTPGKSR